MSDNKSTIKLHKNRNFDIEEHKWLGVCPDECKPYSKTGGHVYYCRAEETQVLIDHIIKQDWHITYLYDQIKEHNRNIAVTKGNDDRAFEEDLESHCLGEQLCDDSRHERTRVYQRYGYGA